jgi:hypothetical protein
MRNLWWFNPRRESRCFLRSSLKRREAESENPRGRSLTPIGCEWSALVVLTNSVVADAREVHWSRVERRSESLPSCAVNAHALKSLPCSDRSVKDNQAHVIDKRKPDRCQFDVSIYATRDIQSTPFRKLRNAACRSELLTRVTDRSRTSNHNSLCAHTQVIDRYSPRPIFAPFMTTLQPKDRGATAQMVTSAGFRPVPQ